MSWVTFTSSVPPLSIEMYWPPTGNIQLNRPAAATLMDRQTKISGAGQCRSPALPTRGLHGGADDLQFHRFTVLQVRLGRRLEYAADIDRLNCHGCHRLALLPLIVTEFAGLA